MFFQSTHENRKIGKPCIISENGLFTGVLEKPPVGHGLK